MSPRCCGSSGVIIIVASAVITANVVIRDNYTPVAAGLAPQKFCWELPLVKGEDPRRVLVMVYDKDQASGRPGGAPRARRGVRVAGDGPAWDRHAPILTAWRPACLNSARAVLTSQTGIDPRGHELV